MKAYSCDLCGKYFTTEPVRLIKRTITDPILSSETKKLEVSILMTVCENSVVPDLCFECFKKEVNAALTTRGESL